MLTFRLAGKLSDDEKGSITHYCQEKYSKEACILTGKTELDFTLDLTAVTAITGTIIAIIDLYLNIRDSRSNKVETAKADLADLRKAIATKLLEIGIRDFSIEEINGLNDLLAGKKDALCRITVSSAGSTFRVLISKDGDINLIEIA